MIINLHGGPGCSKSTLAAKIFSELRKQGKSAELVHEAIKYWAYQGRKCKSFDQCYIFGNQLHSIDFLLQHGIEYIVSDSPLMMQCAYALKYGSVFWNDLVSITNKFEAEHKCCNIFLDRRNIPYEQKGRYENYKEALAMDQFILNFLQDTVKGKLHIMDATDIDGIFEIIGI